MIMSDYLNMNPEEHKRANDDYMVGLKRFKRNVAALNIEPSSFVVDLKSKYDDDCKELRARKNCGEFDYNDYVYETYNLRDEYIANSISKIEEHYGVKFKECSYGDGLQSGEFAVGFENSENCTIKHYSVGNLNKEQFMQLYTDVYTIMGLNTRTIYRDAKYHEPSRFKNEDLHVLSGLDLGELRYKYFDSWGIPNQDTHDILRSINNEPSRSDIAKAKLSAAMKAYGDVDSPTNYEPNY